MGSLGTGVKDGWTTEPIAIIGMSSKFAAEATNVESLWRMIAEGRSGWTPFPSSRFSSEGVYHPNNERLNTTHVKGAHFIAEDVGLFDAAFFSYSGETASSLDPQYRLQLESVYEALENAGLPMAQIAGSNTSVFTGVFVHDYRDGLLRDADNLPRLTATGTGVPMMSNRISHFFDLRGASMTIETACSSGMVAMHQAIQSLRTGEADMSIVGGANLTLNPDMFKALASSGFLSGDGKSYAFDARASGYGRGEGVATIVIKRLKDALEAGDPVRAVIRESMLNQDGKTETITTPSLEAQQELVRACYRKAGLDPRDTQYFEAHGTGTQAGDTVEARAIATVFAARRDPLLVGSVKTNLGHTEAASGLASIIKTVLALERGVIPPSINFEKPNPKLALDEWNLRIVRTLEKWPSAPVRRASINNFGYGGANAHIIIENVSSWMPSVVNGSPAYQENKGEEPDESVVLVLSGKDEQACQRLVANLGEYLKLKTQRVADERRFLQSLAYTLGQRRTQFPWVAAQPVSITQGLGSVMESLESPKFKPVRSSRQPRIGMVFTGQGAQWHAMGRELINSYPVYRESLQVAEGYLREFGAKWSLLAELLREAHDSRINQVGLSTPICVAVQISLVHLLRDWGIAPVAVTSHSSGEIAAAYTVGALSYRAAMAYSYYRAVLASDDNLKGPVPGGMIAVGLGLQETEAYLERLTSGGKAVVACINSPSSITVAGDLDAVMELEQLATADGVFARRLKVETAWHSHHMSPIAEVYVEALDRIHQAKGNDDVSQKKAIAFSSPVTGGRVTSFSQIGHPKHWVKSLMQPVQFVSAFTDMVLGEAASGASNVDAIVEIGPHTALGGPIQQILCLPEFAHVKLPYFGSLVRNTDARESMRALAANLLQQGYPVDLSAVNFPYGRDRHVEIVTDLPPYPWNHQVKHWVEPRFNRALRERSQPPHDLLGSLVDGCNPEAPAWRHTLRISESPWARDHAIQSNIVYPAAGYISLAIEAVRQMSKLNLTADAEKIAGYRLRDVDFLQALMIEESADGIEMQTCLRPVNIKDIGSQGWKHFEVWTVTKDNRWTQHAKGLISIEIKGSSIGAAIIPKTQHGDIKGYTRHIFPTDLFSNLSALGIAHGPMFQNMKSIIQSGSESRSQVIMSIADTAVPNDLARDHVIHPVTLDSVITAPYSAVPGAAAREVAAKVPRSVGNFWISANISNKAGHRFNTHSSLIWDNVNGMAADVLVSNEDDGEVVLHMREFSYQSLGRSLSSQRAQTWETELCNKVDWSLDLSIKVPATLSTIKAELSFKDDPGTEWQLAGLLRHLVHKNPRARILEVGAGSGATTRRALEALGTAQFGGPNASLYQVTGKMSNFSEALQEDLSPWNDILSFDSLDIEHDPVSQGFTASYDVVIASHLLHGATNISAVLHNIRGLLKPDGAVLLTEDKPDQLDQHLRENGFTGIDLELQHAASTSVTILSTATQPLALQVRVEPEKFVIVTSRKASPPSPEWLKNLRESIAACVRNAGDKLPIVQELECSSATAQWYADKISIFIGEVDEPILYELDSASLDGIRAMATGSKGLLWVTRGGAVDCERPDLGLAPGFVRALRNEYFGRKFLTLDLDPKGQLWSEAGVSAIAEVLRNAFGVPSEGASPTERTGTEFEFAERDGMILVPRLRHDFTKNQRISQPFSKLREPEQPLNQLLYQPDRPLRWHSDLNAFGDDLHAEGFLDILPPNFIEIEPKAHGVSLRSADDHASGLGFETAGIVTRIGSEAAAKGFSIGDRVISISMQSSFPSRAVAEWSSTAHMPDGFSFEEAASLPIAFLTAYHALVETARLRQSQSILVHSAAGHVGQAAVSIAQSLGAKVYATVASAEERHIVEERYGIPSDAIFSSQDASFVSATLAATQSRGVDVALNSLTGSLLQATFNLVAPLGHFIDIGGQDLERNSSLEMKPFARSISFSAVDLAVLLEHRKAHVHYCLEESMSLVQARSVKPAHPIKTYAISAMTDVARLPQSQLKVGKVVLTVDAESKVPVMPRVASASLSPDASYLIVGGNGGLGQSVAHWLVSRGARNIVLLSRSAAKSDKTGALAKELLEAGCDHVLPISCDVANEDDLASAIDTCGEEGLPPIRGVIHAAFVLQDSFVEKMTLDDYHYTTRSKVAGAWNLHNQFNLPGDLDFFVLFSSINGILGYASQAAYSAAGAYEDALAHWRVKHCRLPAVSIDLSVVNGVGYVAQADAAETLRKALVKAGRRVIDEHHVLASLEWAILHPHDAQFVVGGINSGPGSHWDVDGDLGRDMRLMPLKYRQPAESSQGLEEPGSDSLATRMGSCAKRDEAIHVVGAALADMLADMFLVPAEDIDLSESPSQQGIDSLVAVEVRNMLFSQAGAELSIFNIMQSPSLTKLAADVVDKSVHVEFAAA